jgi:hypothetical protein
MAGWGVVSALAGVVSLGQGAATAQSFDHSRWDALIHTFVEENGVRYAELKVSRTELDAYVNEIAGVSSASFDSWSRNERIAYLINAYNSLVVLQVIDAYPLRRRLLNFKALFRPANSVWQIPGFFSGISHQVAGRQLTLDDIEHRWLRAELKEPRIHFALVCAAASCPPFRREAYTAERLDQQLDDQAARFLNDTSKNEFDVTAGEVRLSSILEWFGEDFARFAPAAGFLGDEAQRGSLAFAAQFLPASTADWLRDGTYSVRHLEYDWTLNDASRPVARR